MPLRLLSILLIVLPALARAGVSDPDTLSFELPDGNGWFVGWSGSQAGTKFADSTVTHGGRYSARLARDPNLPSKFATATRSIPITFTGATIELRGWLKTQDVRDGFVGLWLRLDSDEKRALQFDNMQNQNIAGTRDWTEYRVTLPLHAQATKATFGALIEGDGTLWVDDLQLLVDGRPTGEAPVHARVENAVERDHEFDAGSNINLTAVSRSQVANLVILAKVWGFLKYHHPQITSGGISWDYELFRVMPAVLTARDSRQAQKTVAAWTDRLGVPAKCSPCVSLPDSIQAKPRINWIRDRKRLGERLTRQLESLYANRPANTTQYYVSLTNWESLQFVHERAYKSTEYPDAGYRLLALFRFWNIIEYWAPYRDLIDESWDGVLAEFIPRLVQASDKEEYVTTMMALIARADDGHASVQGAWKLRPPGGECGLPVAIRNLDGKFVAYEYRDPDLGLRSGIRLGDVVVSIDGEPVGRLVKRIYPYYSGSNQTARLRVVGFNMANGSCGPCSVEVKRADRAIQVNSQREPYNDATRARAGAHDLPGPAFQKLSDDVAYLKLSGVRQAECGSYIEQAAGTRCLLIDIRNYPAEFVPFALGGHFVEKSTPFASFTKALMDNPGAFVWRGSGIIQPIEPRYTGKIAVLVDEATISQSEYTAMAFRAAGAVIVGSQTAGADGDVARVPLPGGINTAISSVGIYYPDRSATQQVGIVPDVVVRPTIKGILEGRDEVAEAAVRHAIGQQIRISMR